MGAIALGFASAVVWGAADFLGGLKSRQVALFAVMLLSQAAGLAPLLIAAAVRGEPPPGADILPWCVLGAVAGTVGLAAFYRGLAVGQMGVVAPISASAAAIPVVFGVASGERPGAVQVAGIAVAIVGVALASWEPREEEPPAQRAAAEAGEAEHPEAGGAEHPEAGRAWHAETGAQHPDAGGAQHAVPRRGVGLANASTGAGLALVAAVGFGLFFVGLDEASDRDLLWALVLTRSVSTGALVLAALATRPNLAMTLADGRTIAAVGILDVSANALFAAGTTVGLVSVVSVLGSLYPVTTIVLARFLLGERLGPVQRGGAVTALVGVALISAG
ncbi:MAG TPA: DMT family transporter [Thermoleophilaceae bacterium]|jgi:drug/metabolite transporter (DMT)-like permease